MSEFDLATIVDAHAEHVYDQLSLRHGAKETMHTQGVCGLFSEKLAVRLFAYNGIKTSYRKITDLDQGTPKRLKYHAYLVFGDEFSGAIADGTWQQFLPASQRTQELPKVLIGHPEEVIKVALAAGITANSAALLWTNT